MISRRSILSTIFAAGLVAVFGSGTAGTEVPINVVASFSILGDMVQQVGGDRVHVTTLVGPDGDAHVYQPTPADARSVAETKLLIVNGLGFEGWMDRLTEASGYKGRVVTATTGVEPLVAGCLRQAVHPALEAQSIDDQQLGLGDRPGICRGRLMDVRVTVRADQGSHINPVTAYLLDHIPQDAERGDNVDGNVGPGGP